MELGLPEILIILMVVLLLFGPSKLPQLGESLGRAIRNFRDASSGRGERPAESPPQQASPRPALPPGQARSAPGAEQDRLRPAEPAPRAARVS